MVSQEFAKLQGEKYCFRNKKNVYMFVSNGMIVSLMRKNLPEDRIYDI